MMLLHAYGFSRVPTASPSVKRNCETNTFAVLRKSQVIPNVRNFQQPWLSPVSLTHTQRANIHDHIRIANRLRGGAQAIGLSGLPAPALSCLLARSATRPRETTSICARARTLNPPTVVLDLGRAHLTPTAQRSWANQWLQVVRTFNEVLHVISAQEGVFASTKSFFGA